MGTKKCSKCKIIKDISFFSKNNKTKDKLHCSCKECDKEKYFKNREQNLLKMREYAALQFGKNYDAYFAWSDKEMYCSELVYKIYMNCINFELAIPKPLRDFNIDAPVVRKIMRERYGENIPYDELMISPGQLYDSPSLITVYSNEK
jgi:hypothetical protein